MRVISRSLGLHNNTVNLWDRVPAEYVFAISKLSGIRPEVLRPDLFMDDPLRRHLITPEMLDSAAAPRVKLKQTYRKTYEWPSRAQNLQSAT